MMMMYDPEFWSCLEYTEQQYLLHWIDQFPDDVLCIRLILERSRAPPTPSRYAFIHAAIVRRLVGR